MSMAKGNFAAFLLMFALVSVPAQAQFLPQSGESAETPAVPAPSPNDIKELNRLLADEGVQQWLRDAAKDEETLADETSQSPREIIEAGVARIGERASLMSQAVLMLPTLPSFLVEEWREGLTSAEKVRGATLLLIFIIVGAGLEWLYRQSVRLPLLRLEQTPSRGPMARVTSAGQRAALIFAGLGIFAAGSIGTFAAFEWPPLVRAMLLDLLAILLVFRALQTVSLFFLAPFAPALRLVPWTTGLARAVHRLLTVATAVILIFSVVYFFFDRIEELGQTAGEDMEVAMTSAALVLGLCQLAVVLVTIFAAGRILPRYLPVESNYDPRLWRRRQFILAIVSILAFAAWVLEISGLFWGLVIFGPLPLMLIAVRAWIDHFFNQATDAIMSQHQADFDVALEEFRQEVDKIEDEAERAAMVEPEMPHLPDPYPVARPILQRAVRFVLILCAIFSFAAIWGVNVFDPDASPLAWGLRVLFDSVVVLLLADLIWTWARSVIDKRLSDYRPPEDGSAPGPEARMITLLPLFRTSILVIVLSMVALTIMTSLGINIAPILAGAGILGIAIGFGTQSLVRDIVSGLFFLIDDAFRVGEYIEVGSLMGAVESISVRSMRIRHHRGKVHTVPYGELKSVTNHSRDWVIMKLEFRVPFETDLQLVKKLVKKVGAELKANDHYGPSILSTLKSQGVRRMEEFNMVVGVKFMTKPGEQWLVRRDAYQKVRDIFEANGIRMAERNVKVEIETDPSKLTEEEKHAIAAAAQEASQPPAGPPKPIPDEP
ncbi:MAG: mechanosensitive ion channel family protein [Pseudomonadota bacterium]